MAAEEEEKTGDEAGKKKVRRDSRGGGRGVVTCYLVDCYLTLFFVGGLTCYWFLKEKSKKQTSTSWPT